MPPKGPKVSFRGFRRDRAAEVRALWRDHKSLAPSWTLAVLILDGGPNGEAAADCGCSPEYGQIEIRLFSPFWDCDPDERACIFRHEVLHAQLWRLTDFCKRLIAFSPEATRDHLAADLVALEESAVQEHAYRLG
jgi:hypothetical protein